jgi:glucose/arabinose dehydrogenase
MLRRSLLLVIGCVLWLAACSQPVAVSPAVQPTLPALVATTNPVEKATAISSTAAPVSTQSATSMPMRIEMPNPSDYGWVQVTNGLTAPTDIKNAGDGSNRLFIVEQPGRILIWKNKQLLAAPFLDISDRVGTDGSERGLLGLAFHPFFSQNGFFYVNYTDKDGNTHIARFTAQGDAANPVSEKQILFVQQPFPNHNGGALAFGPDGYLYIGLGDGGSAGDPYGNGQSGNTLLGKILRLDVNGGDPYAIPADNAYAVSGVAKKEIWASGLRNPWRFSFDSQTGDLWIGDVGQNLWEEIDFAAAGTPAGLNFGWNKMEATHPYAGSNQAEFIAPVSEYEHGPGCSVTGGVVYRGNVMPVWQGVYLYGDYCSGVIWGLITPPDATQKPVKLFETGFKISTFGVDEAGEVYVADYNGAIYSLGLVK